MSKRHRIDRSDLGAVVILILLFGAAAGWWFGSGVMA